MKILSKKICIILAVLAVYIECVFALPLLFRPAITKSEFPFKLIYELNGEILTIDDIIVCEYDGFGPITSAGIDRKWKTYLKNHKDINKEIDYAKIVLLDVSGEKNYDEYGNQIMELYFYGGNAQYYMHEHPGERSREAQGLNKIQYSFIRPNKKIGNSVIDSDTAYEKYKLRLISWECAPPIQN